MQENNMLDGLNHPSRNKDKAHDQMVESRREYARSKDKVEGKDHKNFLEEQMVKRGKKGFLKKQVPVKGSGMEWHTQAQWCHVFAPSDPAVLKGI